MEAGLPDGLFSHHFWCILEGIGMEKLGVFHNNFIFLFPFLVYIRAIWYFL
jgi:hypothetical protein